MFVPVNSIDVSARNHEPQDGPVTTSKMSKKRELTLATPGKEHEDVARIINDHIETFSSIECDPNVTPRAKATRKLTRYIERSFSLTGQVPITTVDFYRIGKLLGKGAFGKVNMALHRLTH